MLKKLHGRKLAVCLIGGAMYAFFSAFGWQAEHGGVIWAGGALLVAALLVWPIAALLAVLLERGYTRALRQKKTFRAGRAFAFILACYVPMFCVAFPGSFAYDVPYQLRQVVTGAYSTHHPLLHTLALGGLLQLGRALGDINLGAALYTALQMALLAGCFALTCGSIARQSGARAAKRATVFFALYPLNMVMAVNATKDVLFGGFFALTLALLNEMPGKAVARAGAENRGLRRAGGDAAQQHGVCRAGVAGAPDARSCAKRRKARRWPCCWRWPSAFAETRR